MELDTKAKAIDNLAHSVLPVELWQEIFPYLSVSAILNCLRSCKAFEYLYLGPLSAKRNYFIVGRVIRYGETPFDEHKGAGTEPFAAIMDVPVGYGNISELSKLCFAACTLIIVSSDKYRSPMDVYPYMGTQWDLQRVLSNTYIAMGSPNIIACFTNVNNDKSDQDAYERFKAQIDNAAQIVLGRNFQHFKTIPLPKKYAMKTDTMVGWYKGPTLRALIGQSNQFLPPLTLSQALAKPDYLRFQERNTQLCMTTAGVQEPPPHHHIKCPIMPYMPWVHPLRANDPTYYTMESSASLVNYPSTGSRPGNCLVSIAVLQNTLRNHFENEIYILGLKRYIHIHLLLEIKEGKVNFVDQVFAGENCMAVATITVNYVTYKQPEDPKLKSAFGKFVANDHCTEVFYGVVTKFDKNHVGDFFEGDVPAAYHRPNVLRERRRQTILDKEDKRKERIKKQRAERKAGRKASKEFLDTAKKLNLVP